MDEINKYPDANKVAALCLRAFETISKSGKPLLDKEWTVLSCIVKYDHQINGMDVISIGTGLLNDFI